MRTLKLQKGVELHFLTKDKFVSLISKNPYIDKVWTIKEEITECVSALKKEQYDLIVDLHKNLRSKRLLVNLGVKSISFDKLNIQKWLRVYTPINALPKYHLIDRYFHAMKKIGVMDDGQGMDFFYKIDSVDLHKKVGISSDRYLCIVLGATYLTKRVPEAIIESIIDQFKNLKIVLLGGKDVSDKGQNFKKRFPQIFDATGILSLAESAALIDHAACVVTGDTGMMHIAAALKKPIVSIWGGTHHDLGMYPYYGSMNADKNISIVNKDINCSPCSKIGKHQCPKGHFKCMLELDHQKVVEAINQQLSTIG